MALATTEQVSLGSLAAEAMRNAEGNVAAAEAELVARLQGDTALYERLIQPIVQKMAHVACLKVQRDNRERSLRPSNGARPSIAQAAYSAMLYDLDTKMDFPLFKGLKLRHARRAEILQCANEYLGQAKTNMLRRDWLIRIAQALPDAIQTVGEVLSEERLSRMYEQAQLTVEAM